MSEDVADIERKRMPTLLRRHWTIRLASWTALSTCLLACSTYKVQPVEEAETIGTRYLDLSAKDISLRVVPLSPADAKSYLGIDLEKDKLLPVLVKLKNRREAPIRIEEGLISVETTSGVECGSLPIEATISRALRSGAGESVAMLVCTAAMGLVGLAVAAGPADAHTTVNRTIEQDYHAKKLQPVILLTDAEAMGVVFIDMKACRGAELAQLTLKFTDLQSDETIESKIGLLDRGAWPERRIADDDGESDR